MELIKLLAGIAFLFHISASPVTSQQHRDFAQGLFSLLENSKNPTVTELDDLIRSLFLSPEYNDVLRREIMNDVELTELVDSSDHSVNEAPKTKQHAFPVSAEAADAVKRKDLPEIEMLYDDSGDTIPNLVRLTREPTTPTDAAYKANKYIVTTVDTLSHLMVVMNRFKDEIKADNYVDLIHEFDEEFSPFLAQLANEATTSLFASYSMPAKWKEVIWQLHLLVANFVAEKKGFEKWGGLHDQIKGTLGKLLEYAVVVHRLLHPERTMQR
jgi:hypothetical protein